MPDFTWAWPSGPDEVRWPERLATTPDARGLGGGGEGIGGERGWWSARSERSTGAP